MPIGRLEVAPELLGKVLELLPPGVKVVGTEENPYGSVTLAIASDHIALGDTLRMVVTTTPLSISAELRKV